MKFLFFCRAMYWEVRAFNAWVVWRKSPHYIPGPPTDLAIFIDQHIWSHATHMRDGAWVDFL